MKKAKYLTVGGHSINEGSEYYTVDFNGKITKNIAGKENNVINLLYFNTKQEAEVFSRLSKLYQPIIDAMKAYEKTNLGK